ncbi:MAG: hypothetical protein JWM68_4695, partial [Verrucomicrobiales bacterium]|nr:hypothetical protein [Verrucomicrobiales bacterium]
MNTGKPNIERNLRRAAMKWKWLRLLQHTGILASVVTLLMLLLGVAMVRGWITRVIPSVVMIVLLGCATAIYLLVLVVIVLSKKLERKWLAGKVEEGQPQLLDRLNTLTFLEKLKLPATSGLLWFYPRIAKQANEVLSTTTSSPRFPKLYPLLSSGVFALILVGTIYFYHRYEPWKQLNTRKAADETRVEKPFSLPPPDANALEQKNDWGEVKITDPAHDMKVTKVDAVQLQIEAAANQQLTNTSWFTTVNGGAEESHLLPPGAEPKYAVYDPVIYVDEFHLSDWDVMTYYAKARTERGSSYASEVYFLEVQPFREDILKMPGGEGGSAYQMLSQLTDLINRQQHVIRQTHHHIQSAPPTPQMEEQDRGKLTGAEKDLSAATKHLYAEMAVTMENKPIGEVLDQLAQAEKTLEKASGSLQRNEMSVAQNDEREALRQLVETRKIYQKTISDNPEAFDDKKQDGEQSPIAEDAKDKLKEIAEFRNEAKATKDFVEQSLKKQQALSEQAKSGSKTNYPKLAQEQRDLAKSLEEFQEQHPQVFKNVTNEVAQAKEAMDKASESFDKKNAQARKLSAGAAKKLDDLNEALNEDMAGHGLANAYKLKKLLDEQIKNLEQVEKEPGNAKQDDLQKMAQQGKQATDELKTLADQKTTGEMFGPELSESLNSTNKQKLDKDLNQLGQSASATTREHLARMTKKELQQVSKAFEKSQPQVTQQAKKKDALKQNEQDPFDK